VNLDQNNNVNNNADCLNTVGIEPANFAFVTRNGRPHAAPAPLDITADSFTPNAATDLFMNAGDRVTISMHDSPAGLVTAIQDHTSGQSGSMTASVANGFAQVNFEPNAATCSQTPYAFHPMYSTSSEQTRVIWAAHSYNVAFSDEIGHFENCEGPNPIPATPFGVDASGNPISCPAGNTEGFGDHTSPTDGDDNFCFPGTEALRIHINGCTDTNTGFDGLSYQPVWPDGSRLHPEPFLFSSPRTGPGDKVNYTRTAFEADLPRIETNTCDRITGTGCTLIPTTDDGTPAAFYPFFSAFQHGAGDEHGVFQRGRGDHSGGCIWAFGTHLRGANDFGRNAQYGTLLSTTSLAFGGGGATINRFNNFRQIIPNPCPAVGNNH
jgi:hypothetical protein